MGAAVEAVTQQVQANITADQAAQFQSIVQSIMQQQAMTDATASLSSRVDNFIAMADMDGDAKVGAEELAAALNISPVEAQNFVNTFNTQPGNDAALDATELTNAIEAVQSPSQPEQAAAGEAPKEEEPGGKPEEASGGKPEKAAAGGESKPAESGGVGGLSDLFNLLMKLLDEDGDGKISPEEAKKFVEKYDKNGDGKLDKEEMKEGLKAEAAEKGVELSDAQLEKISQQVDTFFELGDANQDGGISAEELTGSAAAYQLLQDPNLSAQE